MTSLIKLSADNFTSLQETPWAGNRLADHIKKGHAESGARIGESWEVSCHPDKPSKCEGFDICLIRLFKDRGPELFETSSCNIIVKLIDTSDNLSIQLHPDQNHPSLKYNEGGKPEFWYVIDHQKDAGVHIGFKENNTQSEILKAMAQVDKHHKILDHMNFIEVSKGDYFHIPAGVLHSIGGGVTVIECHPYSVGKNPVTYRLWDWDRNFSSEGELAADGEPRELNVDECINILDASIQTGEVCLNKSRTQRGDRDRSSVKSFPKTGFGQLYILDLDDKDKLSITITSGYAILLVLDHSLDIESNGTITPLELGHTYLTTNAAHVLHFVSSVQTRVAVICPQGTQLHNL